MKHLVIDGNSVYEIDEDCVRHRHPPKDCEVYSQPYGFDEMDGTTGHDGVKGAGK